MRPKGLHLWSWVKSHDYRVSLLGLSPPKGRLPPSGNQINEICAQSFVINVWLAHPLNHGKLLENLSTLGALEKWLELGACIIECRLHLSLPQVAHLPFALPCVLACIQLETWRIHIWYAFAICHLKVYFPCKAHIWGWTSVHHLWLFKLGAFPFGHLPFGWWVGSRAMMRLPHVSSSP